MRFILLFLFLCLLSSTGIGITSADANGTLLVAIYASGGTLEQESGLITSDVLQMVNGLDNGTAISTDNCTVVLAYGGADKPGWYGMTIADLGDLRKDLSDEVLGNDMSFRIHLPDADMGDPKSLDFFLSHIREYYHYERMYLIFIGHGQAYTGMLFDQNHDEDGLTIGELTESLKTGPEIELIGFDSCLMGCLEIVSALSPYATYAIASEESEPADGWPYRTWMEFLVNNPQVSVEEHARELIQEYMKTPGQGKTIGLIYLKDAGYLTQQLDTFAKDLYALVEADDGCSIITTALSESQQFGLTGTGELDEATMDLYDFADTMRSYVPYLSESATGVIEGVNRTVVFSKHDENVPGAHGIAVLSPVQIDPVFYNYYRESAFITPSWDRFIARYLEKCFEKSELLPESSSGADSNTNT